MRNLCNKFASTREHNSVVAHRANYVCAYRVFADFVFLLIRFHEFPQEAGHYANFDRRSALISAEIVLDGRLFHKEM